MRSIRNLLVGTATLLGLWIGWGTYVSRTTERVPSETLERFDGVEIRRYPRTVLVETTAPDARTAFRRLFRYISGANGRREDVAMTAPVAVRGTAISMTAPVRTGSDGGDVTMAFYLPRAYTPETAPMPTDPAIRLVVESPRTVAVRRFSWYATDERVDRERTRLLEQLSHREFDPRGEPTLLQYNDPWTPPFMRTNEVEVELADAPEQVRRKAP
ncbi:SOUL family heme-binding protein [Halopiger xanaduensis]|uniref:SOUL heme-binding protein n=1 Tax=Halopiger xanaduensis (strain DSM 18323 / JCM 14033 / SH-6) TaxID=797210 RepID=F8DE72_HALXS|nr:heme-binding protein [Halopiger xanaduensis]AEH39349.1 SOUL heme-binding protein [Halopiger xanaduensis SH-6]